MKGKNSFRYSMPNVARFRSRIENPSADLTKQVREALSEVICEVLNENQIAIRSKMIARFANKGLKFKSKQHEMKVQSVVENFFDAYFAPTEAELQKFLGEEGEAETEENEETENEAEAPAPAETEDFED